MGVEEFFQTLLIMLMVTSFFIIALAFLYLIYEKTDETGK